ncbi:17597_t:CDS:2, partial [Racocetra persica]
NNKFLLSTSLFKTEIYVLTPTNTGFTQLSPSTLSSFHIFSSFNFPYKLTNKLNNPLHIQIDYKEILALNDIFDFINTTNSSQLIPQINILTQDIQLIYDITNLTIYQNQLSQLYSLIQNLDSQELHFHTDASIQNLQSPNIKSATIPYPDTTRAKLEAIISLLLATSNNTHIHIHLDNKIAIKNLKQ